jgi:hypothetical protein
MRPEERVLEVDRVGDDIIEALQGGILPLAGVHFNERYSCIKRDIRRKLPSDGPDE